MLQSHKACESGLALFNDSGLEMTLRFCIVALTFPPYTVNLEAYNQDVDELCLR